MRHFATICAAAALSATLVFAQTSGRRDDRGTPPDPQAMAERRVNMLARMLDLTDSQKAQAVSLFTNAMTASQGIQPNLQTARQSLFEAIKKNDVAAIESLAINIGTLTGQLTAIEAKADAAFYSMLTADQQAKFDAMPRGRFGFGIGGPGGGLGPMGPGGMGQSRTPRSQGQ
jgi:Spy/CpxP family protein refolding chaperone